MILERVKKERRVERWWKLGEHKHAVGQSDGYCIHRERAEALETLNQRLDGLAVRLVVRIAREACGSGPEMEVD